MTPTELKKYRAKLRLTQVQMAEKLGLSERFWQYLESGSKPITITIARAVRDLIKHPKKDA